MWLANSLLKTWSLIRLDTWTLTTQVRFDYLSWAMWVSALDSRHHGSRGKEEEKTHIIVQICLSCWSLSHSVFHQWHVYMCSDSEGWYGKSHPYRRFHVLLQSSFLIIHLFGSFLKMFPLTFRLASSFLERVQIRDKKKYRTSHSLIENAMYSHTPHTFYTH
jgi:hypothetical protein